ncbi:uncharacterized protein G2W53_020800 [Senna tora]|uniref:Uncharacterized protein n=1 Tax=Senna tora TaxID=362788 RepID=A0A834TKU0_9FABA|nr:uncharacterized protein G2W53_020800 [Senna tora]
MPRGKVRMMEVRKLNGKKKKQREVSELLHEGQQDKKSRKKRQS